MRTLLKRAAARLPSGVQQSLKRWQSARQIGRGTFQSLEPEWNWIGMIVRRGDWVLDIGANIGHYTVRLGQLVGPAGRVIAFEPMAESIELLASNVRAAGLRNVTILQAAAHDSCTTLRFSVPSFDSGLLNYYQAQADPGGNVEVLALPLHAVLPVARRRLRLIKLDAEGGELSVLLGLNSVIQQDRPVLIIEDNDPAVRAWLKNRGYRDEVLPESPNRIYTYVGLL